MSITSKAPNPEKGKRYLGLLDQALCNGNWSEVPELARKTDKHAPERKCFTLVARTEAQIASASHRPTSASSTGESSIHGLGETIPKLKEAISVSSTSPDEAYCASTCLAEIHWLQEDPAASLQALPKGSGPSKSGSGLAALGWLEVCAAKSAFLRTAALEATGQDSEVQNVYLTAITQAPGSRTPELRRWTERLLARACMYSFRRTSQPSLPSFDEALRAFRAWANFWQRAPPPASGSGISPSRIDIPRRAVWKAYYDLLSLILRRNLLYSLSASAGAPLLVVPSEDIPYETRTDAKIRQRSELKRVEATYESLLLNETQFPRASQSNTVVEEWVQQAVGNWKIICGSGWTEAELGEGGKESASRNMLDILYRAANKTFHSTTILRQLFYVHAALGEFELAVHAFHSYEEIVGKGKARAEKTGKHELGFDNDDTALLTAAEAVRILCRYGDREQAEKAVEVAKTVRKWLGQHRPTSSTEAKGSSDDNRAQEAQPPSRPTESQLRPATLAAAYRALGICQAHWARLTYETETRAGLQAEAIENLRQAQHHDDHSVETSYALARVLAETQQISAAIEVAKRSIAVPSTADAAEDEGGEGNLVRQRQLLPVWHLLSMCLTARDEFEPASRMCDAAFDQFGDASVLFGDTLRPPPSVPEKGTNPSSALVDQMDSFEKEALLQIKMSQLTFIELMEGATVAVDSTDELLTLYTRLFGSREQMKAPVQPPSTAISTAPSQGGGTLRSMVGSVRPKSTRLSAEKEPLRGASNSFTTDPATSATLGSQSAATNGQAVGAPVAITVTNEDGVSADKGHRHHDHHLHMPFKLRGHHGEGRDGASVRSMRVGHNMDEKSGAPNGEDKPLPLPPKDTDVTDHAHGGVQPPAVQSAVQQSMSPENPASPQQPLKAMEHNAPHDLWPPPAGHDEQPPEQDIRLPAPHPAANGPPAPHFASIQERQLKMSTLVKMWLFIAGLYIRAELYDDANGAVSEATRIVEAFEKDKLSTNANARDLFDKGWGGGKSVDALWADVYSARGDLASAREQPFEALSDYEQALLYFPDHPCGIIGVSDLLMDIYEEKMPAEPPKPLFEPVPSVVGSLINLAEPGPSRPASAKSTLADPGRTAAPNVRHRDPTPAELNRLAARDRAYMLLSNLTRLGSGWDNPEAWYTLARAHELSRQIGKAKQALWWVVELEDHKPMRPWSEITAGGYTL